MRMFRYVHFFTGAYWWYVHVEWLSWPPFICSRAQRNCKFSSSMFCINLIDNKTASMLNTFKALFQICIKVHQDDHDYKCWFYCHNHIQRKFETIAMNFLQLCFNFRERGASNRGVYPAPKRWQSGFQ